MSWDIEGVVTLERHGMSLVLVRPTTEEARDWLQENTEGTWWCGALVVEPRYVLDLLNGMRLEVEHGD